MTASYRPPGFGAGDPAASYALVQHAMLCLVPILIGASFLWYQPQSWQDVLVWASPAVRDRRQTAGAGSSRPLPGASKQTEEP
jgi:hypothetical protein